MRAYNNLKGFLFAFGFSVFFLAFSTSAQASFLIEPYLGYNLTASGDAGGTDYSYHGPQYGLRTGLQFLGLMGGLAVNKSNYDMEAEKGSTKTTSTINRTEVGVFAGYDLPILFRVWGAYYFSSKGKVNGGGEYKGNTKELGLGFTALPFLSLNAAYRMAKFDEYEKTGASALTNDIDTNEVVFSVSLPLNL